MNRPVSPPSRPKRILAVILWTLLLVQIGLFFVGLLVPVQRAASLWGKNRKDRLAVVWQPGIQLSALAEQFPTNSRIYWTYPDSQADEQLHYYFYPRRISITVSNLQYSQGMFTNWNDTPTVPWLDSNRFTHVLSLKDGITVWSLRPDMPIGPQTPTTASRMPAWVALPIAILTIFAAGAVVLCSVVSRPARLYRLERIAYCWPLGMTALSIPMFVLAWAGVRVGGWTVVAAVAVAVVVMVWRRKDTRHAFWTAPCEGDPIRTPLSEFELLLVLIILACLAARLTASLLAPLSDWDSLGNWGFKSKILFYDTIQSAKEYWYKGEYQFMNQHYPLLVPIMYSWICKLLGRWDDLQMLILNPINLMAFTLLLYTTIRKFASRVVSLTITAIMASLPASLQYTECGQGDIPLMLIGGASLFCLFDWMRHRQMPSIIMAAILMGGAMFTKEEGKILFVGHLCAAGASILFCAERAERKRLWGQLGVYAFVALLLAAPYLIFRSTIPYPHYELPLTLFTSRWKELPQLLWTIICNGFYFFNQMGLPKWNLLWMIVPAFLILSGSWRVRPWWYLLVIAFLQGATVALIILITSPNPITLSAQEIGFERYTLNVLPPVWLVLAQCAQEWWIVWRSPTSEGGQNDSVIIAPGKTRKQGR